MMNLLVCTVCGHLFEEPKYWQEVHGLDSGPYEIWSGCPHCSGHYVEAFTCDCCDKWIVDDYIKTADGQRFCNDCFFNMELGEEDIE